MTGKSRWRPVIVQRRCARYRAYRVQAPTPSRGRAVLAPHRTACASDRSSQHGQCAALVPRRRRRCRRDLIARPIGIPNSSALTRTADIACSDAGNLLDLLRSVGSSDGQRARSKQARGASARSSLGARVQRPGRRVRSGKRETAGRRRGCLRWA